MRVPTSVILERPMGGAPADAVTFAWVVSNLGERTFGTVMLLIALVGLVPGTSGIVGILLAIPAIQMMVGRREPALPRRIATRRIPRRRFLGLLKRVVPVMRWMERVVRPRWATPFEATKRVIGAIMLLAFAFLEEDGILLGIALFMAMVSLAISGAAVWGTIEAGLLL